MNKLEYSSITKMIWIGCPNKTISTAYGIGSLNKLLFGIIKEKKFGSSQGKKECICTYSTRPKKGSVNFSS